MSGPAITAQAITAQAITAQATLAQAIMAPVTIVRVIMAAATMGVAIMVAALGMERAITGQGITRGCPDGISTRTAGLGPVMAMVHQKAPAGSTADCAPVDRVAVAQALGVANPVPMPAALREVRHVWMIPAAALAARRPLPVAAR